MSNALRDHSRLTGLAGANRQVLHDATWQMQTDVVMAEFRRLARGIEVLATPRSLDALHRDWLEIAVNLRLAAVQYADGLARSDLGLIASSNVAVAEIGSVARSATIKIEALCQ